MERQMQQNAVGSVSRDNGVSDRFSDRFRKSIKKIVLEIDQKHEYNSSFLVTFHEYIPCGIHAWKLQLSRDISGICFLQDTHMEMQETPAFLLIS